MRLGTDVPKVLIPVAGTTLLERHRVAFSRWGFSRQIWVLGYRQAEIRQALKRTNGPFEVVVNEDKRSGSGYSLMLGLKRVGGAACFMDADLMYDSDIFGDLDMSASGVLYSPKESLDGEAVKVYGEPSRVAALRKADCPDMPVLGESVGLGFLDAAGVGGLIRVMESFLSGKGSDFEWESVVECLTRKAVLRPIKTTAPWIEIDFPADIVKAERIAAGSGP